VQDEIFGPFVVLEQFEDEQEAVKRANHSEYGLSASVWTRDGARQMRVARALRMAPFGSMITTNCLPRPRLAATAAVAWADSTATMRSTTSPRSSTSTTASAWSSLEADHLLASLGIPIRVL